MQSWQNKRLGIWSEGSGALVCKVKFPNKHLVQDTLLAQSHNTFHSYEGLPSGSTRVWSIFHKYPDNQLSVFSVKNKGLRRLSIGRKQGTIVALDCIRLLVMDGLRKHSSYIPRMSRGVIFQQSATWGHFALMLRLSAASKCQLLLVLTVHSRSQVQRITLTSQERSLLSNFPSCFGREMREESDQEKLFRRTPPVCPLSLLRFSG